MPLASMMDMMTIILLFLLKSYSTTGVLVRQVDEIDLPLSSITTIPREALSIVVDSGLRSGLPGVYVEHEGERSELLDDAATMYREPSGAAAHDPRSMILPGLENFLMEHAFEARELEEQFGIPFEGEVTVQADAAVNYNSILKVLNTCGTVGFNKPEFIVVRTE